MDGCDVFDIDLVEPDPGGEEGEVVITMQTQDKLVHGQINCQE